VEDRAATRKNSFVAASSQTWPGSTRFRPRRSSDPSFRVFFW